MPDILGLITSMELQSRLNVFRLMFGSIGFFFLFFIIYTSLRTSYLKVMLGYDLVEFASFTAFGSKSMTRRWRKLLERLETGNEEEYKLAIIEADTILADAFKKMNLTGETFELQVRTVTTALVPNLVEIQAAHQTRNSIVHDPTYRLTRGETETVLGAYEATFRNLDLI
jgi:hypothetical protein